MRKSGTARTGHRSQRRVRCLTSIYCAAGSAAWFQHLYTCFSDDAGALQAPQCPGRVVDEAHRPAGHRYLRFAAIRCDIGEEWTGQDGGLGLGRRRRLTVCRSCRSLPSARVNADPRAVTALLAARCRVCAGRRSEAEQHGLAGIRDGGSSSSADEDILRARQRKVAVRRHDGPACPRPPNRPSRRSSGRASSWCPSIAA